MGLVENKLVLVENKGKMNDLCGKYMISGPVSVRYRVLCGSNTCRTGPNQAISVQIRGL